MRKASSKSSLVDSMSWLPGFGPGEDPLEDIAFEVKPTSNLSYRPEVPSPGNITLSIHDEEPIIVNAVPTAAIKSVVPMVRAKPALWPMLEESALDALNGEATKYESNLEAIELLKKLGTENRPPRDAERITLNRYTGWGAISKVFDEDRPDAAWTHRRERLRAALTDDEYVSARASTPNAHYTEPFVIRAMWKAVEKLGFNGGRILEPSAGVGYFLGLMPTTIADNSSVTAVELDQISGHMLKSLYAHSDVDVRIGAFEKQHLPESHYDLAIGNVPFGNYQVPDMRNKPYAKWSIHNYFLGRCLDLVRPGGLLAFITTSFTMDGTGHKAVREYFATHADLVAAIRLPDTTFKRIAHTSVTTDILIFQRRASIALIKPDWINVESVSEADMHRSVDYATRTGKKLATNLYYHQHPEMHIGKVCAADNGYSKSPGARFDGTEQELQTAIEQAVDTLPGKFSFVPALPNRKSATHAVSRVEGDGFVKPGCFVLQDGRVMVSEGDYRRDVHDGLQKTRISRISGMVQIREVTRELIALQTSTEGDAVLAPLQRKLNYLYDIFVGKWGWLSSRANTLAMRGDPEIPLLLSLEIFDEEAGTAEKAAIFSMRTIDKQKMVERCENLGDALAVTLGESAEVNLARIAQLTSMTEEEARDGLSEAGLIFHDPSTGDWQCSDEYLSGNIRDKIAVAQAAGKGYEGNATALQSVLPKPLNPEEIIPRLGAGWIPADDVRDFMLEHMAVTLRDHGELKVAYQAGTASWSVSATPNLRRQPRSKGEVGTARIDAYDIFQHALNQTQPTVKDPEKDGKYIVNKNETLAAREKMAALKDKFQTWIFRDQDRRERLVAKYNDEFNCVVPRKFDGAHLTYIGLASDIEMREHQNNATWRIVAGGNTGLFHVVGAGKTLVYVASTMELKRLGRINKAIHVVPNHLLGQYCGEWMRAYPAAHVLMATKEDLARERRREFLARIVTGDWDGVVMTQSTFSMLGMSYAYTERFIREEIAELDMAIRLSDKNDERFTVKQLEKHKKQLEVRLERNAARSSKEEFVSFEELGCDLLVVDEAHYYKNLLRVSKMPNIAGLPNSSSERAMDMLMKTRYLMKDVYGGQEHGVVLGTATPVANSMAELHVMMRYLMPYTLARSGLSQFDAWAAHFGEAVTALELSPDGSGYRMNTRFARFVNIPDLMALFRTVADIKTRADLNLPTPRIKGGKPQTIVCSPSDALLDFVKSLVERAENVRNGLVKPNEDNMLAITHAGRMAALDMRLVRRFTPHDPQGKLQACVDKNFEVWGATHAKRGTQLIFSDLSTPDNARWNVYGEVKKLLTEKGVPECEIAFIHDHDSDKAKDRLFRSVRQGTVRILIGSTLKMGAGTNVQKLLKALHNLDAPWRPADVEQRIGRIDRQGNDWDEIEIYNYVTEKSFDAYMWQTLETKAKFIAQVMRGDAGLRTAEDLETGALTFAEIKALASGNPLVLKKAGIDAEVAKLSIVRNSHMSSQWSAERDKHITRDELRTQRLQLQQAHEDVAHVKSNGARAVEVHVMDQQCGSVKDAALALGARWDAVRTEVLKRLQTAMLGTFGEFNLIVRSHWDATELFVEREVKGRSRPNRYTVNAGLRSMEGLVKAALIAIEELETYLPAFETRVRNLEARLDELDRILKSPFEFADKLSGLLREQEEINAMLDLDKDQAGALDGEAMPAEGEDPVAPARDDEEELVA